MKQFLKNIAQGVYDGLQNSEQTKNKYTFQEIYNVILEFVSYFFLGLILTVCVSFIWAYFKVPMALSGILASIWALVLYYFLNSKDVKNIKKK